MRCLVAFRIAPARGGMHAWWLWFCMAGRVIDGGTVINRSPGLIVLQSKYLFGYLAIELRGIAYCFSSMREGKVIDIFFRSYFARMGQCDPRKAVQDLAFYDGFRERIHNYFIQF